MDIEWAKDGNKMARFTSCQARPETVKSRSTAAVMERYLQGKGKVIVEAEYRARKIGSGPVRIVQSITEMDRVKQG